MDVEDTQQPAADTVGAPPVMAAALLMAAAHLTACVQVTVAQGPAQPKLVDLDRQLAVTTSLDEDSKENL